ncbi:cytochrome c oxidase subunit II [Fulvitalea axinellae]
MNTILNNIFQSVSEDADTFNRLFYHFLWAAGIVFLLVMGATVYVILKFRVRKFTKALKPEPKMQWLERATIFLASGIILLFLALTIMAVTDIQRQPEKGQQADIVIVGHQWWWEIRYPEEWVMVANELHIPTGKRLWVRLESADVVHDWYVPALGRKADMVPGVTNYIWMQARKPGVYEGACNEYCGAQHAWMRIRVVAHSPQDFGQWINSQQELAKTPSSAIAEKGKALFEEKVCGNCHAIRGTKAVATVGPDLTHVASRKTLLGGKYENNFENLRAWIANPQGMKPGAHMPNFIMTEKEIDAIAAYLYTLK